MSTTGPDATCRRLRAGPNRYGLLQQQHLVRKPSSSFIYSLLSPFNLFSLAGSVLVGRHQVPPSPLLRLANGKQDMTGMEELAGDNTR